MRVLQAILPIYLSLSNVASQFPSYVMTSGLSEITAFKAKSSKGSGSAKGTKMPYSKSGSGSAKGTKMPYSKSAKSSKAPKGTKAPDPTDPPATDPPATDPPAPGTAAPTGAPTALCIGSEFFATFDAPKQNPDDKSVKGSLKGTYLDGNKVDLKLSINFRDRTFNKVTLNDGDLLDWSINTKWDNPDIYGWNNKCRPGRTGKHHDRSVACSSLSEFNEDGKCTKPNGRTVSADDYECKPKKASKTCERGDLSGKLGPLVVTITKNGFPKVTFKGTDKFFLKRRDAELAEEINEPFSIVISKNGENFICAQFILKCDNK